MRRRTTWGSWMQKVFQSSQHCWAGSTMLRSWFLSFASIWLQCCNDGSHEFPVLNDTVDLRYDMTWSTTRIYPVCRRDRNHDFDAFPFNRRVGVLEWRDMNGTTLCCSESLRACACCTCLPIKVPLRLQRLPMPMSLLLVLRWLRANCRKVVWISSQRLLQLKPYA